jgi:D-alanyl-lipoteichoic acid acyltransferase DltB (MBOAT superfamily)
MLFNSIEFLFFFPLVTLLYFLLPYKCRWALLLLASCVFYIFFKVIYILILFFTIIVDYFAGILIEQAKSKKRKKLFLLMSLIANIGVLSVFKYYNFFNGNITGLLHFLGYHNPIPYLNILLPIGLSFHTFQAMSYTIEVYRGHKAERNLGIYALYVMFYPQLVAGPIERPQNIIYQFYEKHKFNYEDARDGLLQMLWGFIKKCVIADRLALIVNPIFHNVYDYSGAPLLIASVFFTFQVYCDFSGYSDIAIGAARVMGFRLMKNFDRPLASKSITEVWRRWHISLSSWIHDYLFTPLAVSFRNLGLLGLILASTVSFTLIGLWHGASWNFVFYGFLQSIFICYELVTKKIRKSISRKVPSSIYKSLSILITFSAFCFSNIFFRAKTFNDAVFVIKHLFIQNGKIFDLLGAFTGVGISAGIIELSFLFIILLIIIEFFNFEFHLVTLLKRQPLLVRWSVYYSAIVFLALFGVFEDRQFIYFQF